ncbi:MAG: stalk domain-containing protein [Agathobaculum desmolans]|uniref:CAP domain-containing protein n=1 Tax=Agathobaculum desmolans TaxID=39484 RepID=UPI0039944195
MKANLASLLCTAALLASGIPSAGAADTVTAIPTREMGQTVYVNDTCVTPTGYNIADNNYFKLRDIAALVGIDVEWNQETQTVEISSERTSPRLEGIMDNSISGAVAELSNQRFALDGYHINIKAYLIGGNNYVKLRDIGKQVGFGVSYDAATESVRIDTDVPYTEETVPVSGSAITRWNKTMAEFNQTMIDGNWRPEKYLETAKKYAPVITGKANGTVEDVIAALDAMKGAPVDAVSFEDNRTVNHFWADELRKALGQEVTNGGDSMDSNAGNSDNSSSSTTVTDEMLRTWELQMVDRINEERRKAGVAELEIDEDLMWSSGFWAEHLTTDFRHAEYGEIKELADAQGIPVRDDIEDVINGENIAGAVVPNDNPVTKDMKKFMASEGHRNTILNREWARVGIGFALSDNGQVFCCQHFGR